MFAPICFTPGGFFSATGSGRRKTSHPYILQVVLSVYLIGAQDCGEIPGREGFAILNKSGIGFVP